MSINPEAKTNKPQQMKTSILITHGSSFKNIKRMTIVKETTNEIAKNIVKDFIG